MDRIRSPQVVRPRSPQARVRRSEQGSAMAWTAIFLATVLMPLMLFVVDGSRLLYVRGRLQTATDAACEDAAWAAGDRLNYIHTGQTRLSGGGVVIGVAQNTLARTLDESTRMAFTPLLSVTLDYANNRILCSATARVPVIFNAVGVAPQVDLRANAISAVRFR